MDFVAFFDLPAVALPKTRNQNDFLVYLKALNAAYLDAVDHLNVGCPHCDAIRLRRQSIVDLIAAIEATVECYLDGRPAAALQLLSGGLAAVQNVDNLVSRLVLPADTPTMYRMSKMRHAALSKARIFHIPFTLRHRVGRHRYGIPGFPCLYLGGSLRVCQLECDVLDHNLGMNGVAAFRFRQAVRFLDFGYRPSFVGRLVTGLILNGAPNPDLATFITRYAVSWPLIAACSIRRMHDDAPFAAEYMIPHLTLQWIRGQNNISGIRFFSTRMPAAGNDFHAIMNYAFPAKLPAVGDYSQPLRTLFDLTDPIIWQGMHPKARNAIRTQSPGWRNVLRGQFVRTEQALAGMPMAPL